MLRTVKPRNARSKRALEKREPKAVENPKTALFLRGTSCSQIKNEIHPFEDASSLEFFSEKNDASLFVFGSTSKKRPHALTFARMFGHKTLDMLELYLDPELPPHLPSPIENEYTLAKSMLTDFFAARETTEKIDVEGLQYIVSVTAEDPVDDDAKPTIHVRVYLIQTKRSGQRLPRVETMLKEALKKPKGAEEKTKKNITTDIIGDKIGRIHIGKQDLSKLQSKRAKGLKRGRNEAETENDDVMAVSEEELKRQRV
ncbi:unnamed protein product [Parascedosporium putredinis]|uniref:Ribosome production factor 2 homolog n=1 Tax=Parascedosporium putredinis TaxID=1442378 RepID=A0A9P1H629_9PEZI|nr:unnamed protein product [Parascedosporium putredinis]CAI7998478.1 unnamed protein product [Parascedosporium putredinis]